jgi:DegV family protein with EDD domain
VSSANLPDMPGTLVVTDSTASLSAPVAAEHGIVVVPLQVVIGADEFDEGSDSATPEKVAEALREFVPVTTSRPNPARMLEIYQQAAADGYRAVVSIHLSAQMSGTWESAHLAAEQASIPVIALDTRQVGPAVGFAALSAVAAGRAGATPEQMAQAASARAAAATSLFYVDTLEYLRRGGRIGTAAALLGGALAVKPLLQVEDGKVASLEKVRTSARALARLENLVVEAAGSAQVEVTVCHLANPERAETLAARLVDRLGSHLTGRPVDCLEVGAVLGAHVGPGMVAVCVAPYPEDRSPTESSS